MTYGLTSSGFVVKPMDVIVSEIREALESLLGVPPCTRPDDPMDILVNVFADRESDLWELGQSIYGIMNRNNASGVLLDNVCNLLLQTRQPATYGTATVTLGGTATTVVPVASVVATADGLQFSTTEEGIIPCDVDVVCLTEGEISVGAGEITVIVTPISGWTTVTNAAVAVSGQEEETDAAFRMRCSQTPGLAGRGTVDSIYSRLMDPDQMPTGLSSAAVYENNTDDVDGDGRPGHTIEVVVYPDTVTQTELGALLWACKPAGIPYWGTTSEGVTDDQGNTQTVYFTLVDNNDVDIDVDVTALSTFPADGDDQIAEALFDYVNALLPGETVYLHKLIETISAAVVGIEELTVEIGAHGGATSAANYEVAYDEIAKVNAIGDITVVVT